MIVNNIRNSTKLNKGKLILDGCNEGWHSTTCSTANTELFPFRCCVRPLRNLISKDAVQANMTFSDNHTSCNIFGKISIEHNHLLANKQRFNSKGNFSETPLLVLFSQSTIETFPNTPNPLKVESCGVLLCEPEEKFTSSSNHVHCKPEWLREFAFRASSEHALALNLTLMYPLNVMKSRDARDFIPLVLAANPIGVREKIDKSIHIYIASVVEILPQHSSPKISSCYCACSLGVSFFDFTHNVILRLLVLVIHLQ